MPDQIINDYVDTSNENDLEDAEYFNQQDELLFDPVVETLNTLNSPDNGYLAEHDLHLSHLHL
jgi:hypothetical protein